VVVSIVGFVWPAMEYRSQALPPALASAVSFFTRLNEAGVRYGVFKSTRNTLMGLDGGQDLDILVAREDYHRFCTIASECGSIRSVNHWSLVSPGREDWFVPDFERARYLHLDVHTSVRLGGKFNKRYPCFTYGNVRQWDIMTFAGGSIPIVSPQDEVGILLSRAAFRSSGKVAGSWQRLTRDWAQEISELLLADGKTGPKAVRLQSSAPELCCRIKKQNGDIWVHRGDLADIRRIVKMRCGASNLSAFVDPVENGIRHWSYAAARFIARLLPGAIMDRRRPASGGLIVAVVAPDGMGKTTQVDRMYRLFSWKFCCVKLYLGSGDGEGWWLRRLARTLYIGRRSKIKDIFLKEPGTERRSSVLASLSGSFLVSLWGVLVALERHSRVRAARRMADRGFLVFCDRWPQSVQPGFMDGPTEQRKTESSRLLRRWELSLYERMSRIQPDVSVHLVGDYAVSQRRKPGELSHEGFDKRITLMEEIRIKEPRTHLIDAAGDVDQVLRSLFGLIWNTL